MKSLKDQKGKDSMVRVAVVFSALLLVYMLYEFRVAYRLEIARDTPDYKGLVALFGAMVLQFALVVVLKVWQKKYERD